MARIRTIKPEFWKHEDLSALPEATHLLAAALLNYADDEGYFNANVALIKAECSPLREPSVSIHGSLTELSGIGYIRIGKTSDGKCFGQIIHFLDHQRVSHPTPSKISKLEILWEDSLNPHGGLTEDSVKPPHTLHADSALNGKERKGMEGKGTREDAPPAHTPEDSGRRLRQVPPSWEPGLLLPGQARPQPGVDVELELMNFRAHSFERPKRLEDFQGEWIKWLNGAKPRNGPKSMMPSAPPRTERNML